MSRNYNSNPITIEEIALDVAKLSASLGINPQELTLAKYTTSGGQFGETTIRRKGGWAKIKSVYFPEMEKDLATIDTLKKTSSYVSKLENVVGTKLNVEDLVKEVIGKLNVKVTPKKLFKKKKTKGETVDLVAMLNDLHVGQIIDAEEIGGLNKFNFKEAGRRVAMFVKEIANYKDYKRDQVGTLHIPLNGDLIAGIIHNTTTHSQHLMVHQMNALVHILTNALDYLRQDFANIQVYGIAGNHDRMTHKEHGKRAISEVYDSYANIGFYSLSAIFKNCKDIKFEFPKTPYVFMNLPAGRAMVAHGDHVFSKALGSVGKSINVAGLTNAIRDFNNGEIAKGNAPIKLLLLGHVHCFAHFITVDGVEVYIAPSLSGIDSFAHSLTINNNMSAQVVFESTPKFILGDSRLIRLNDADNDSGLDSIIPVYNKDLKWQK